MARTHIEDSAFAVSQDHRVATKGDAGRSVTYNGGWRRLPVPSPNCSTIKLAWKPSELADKTHYVVHLSNEDKHELDTALESFLGLSAYV